MKKIIITGAAGFIGYHLVKKIIKKKYKLILIDNFSRGKKDKFFKEILKNKKIKFLNQNLTRPFKLNDNNIKYIFHLAARIGVKNVIEKPSETINDNLLMLINTINAVKKKNKKVKIIFFSTSEIYSPVIANKTAKFPLKENIDFIINNKVQPRDSYYISKLVGEKIVELSGFDFINLRPHNVYGPRMGFSHVIPELINKFKDKEKRVKIFSPTHKRAFCYVDDAVNQMVKLAFNKKANNFSFNIGNNEEEIKIIDLANKIKKLIKSEKKIIKGNNTPGSPIRRVPDLQKTKKLIKKFKFINLDQGLKNYINWFQKK